MQRILETARTQIRPFEPFDVDEAYSWFSDPEVMRYIPYGPDSTIEQTSDRISRYIEHQNTNGFSKWVIVDLRSGKLIGDSRFYYLPDGKRIELGYRLSRAYWGQGLATEVGEKWLNVSSEFFEDQTVFAFAHPENAASLRVMIKLGFKYAQNEKLYGLDAPLYARDTRKNS